MKCTDYNDIIYDVICRDYDIICQHMKSSSHMLTRAHDVIGYQESRGTLHLDSWYPTISYTVIRFFWYLSYVYDIVLIGSPIGYYCIRYSSWMLYSIRYSTTHLVCNIVCYFVNVRYRMGTVTRRIAISYGISYDCYIPYEIVLQFISWNRIGYSSHTISHTIFHVYDIVDPVYDVLYVFVCFLVHAQAGSNAARQK